jgi:hypothetical protein
MKQAYSQLKQVLGKRQMSVPELRRRIEQNGMAVNLKSLYRLSKTDEPLEKLDLRIAGVICEICRVPLSELIVFETKKTRIEHFPGNKQRRLEALMAKNNEGRLIASERVELQSLVNEAEELTLSNARLLARQKRDLNS